MGYKYPVVFPTQCIQPTVFLQSTWKFKKSEVPAAPWMTDGKATNVLLVLLMENHKPLHLGKPLLLDFYLYTVYYTLDCLALPLLLH